MNFRSNEQTPMSAAFKRASIPSLHHDIKVISGTEENIFGDVYVTGVLPNNHVVKFKKNALVFS